jgi:formylmethanofuran dehydrogenase subunit E
MLDAKEKEQLIEKIFAFHHKRAPGIVIGVDMVELALEKLGPIKERLNAVCEGQSCLIDVLQVMTGCTYGNKYLRVINNLGRFALSLFDRFDGRGIRVSVNLKKIDSQKTPEMAKFFTRTRSKDVKEGGQARIDSALKIMAEYAGLQDSILEWEPVHIIDYKKPPMYPADICNSCGETFLIFASGETRCEACKGEVKYFEPGK